MSLIADVFDVILVDSDGEVIATTTLTEANIEVSVQESDVRGGKGNQLLGILHSDRDIAINLSDAEFKYEWMAKQLGQDIATGAGVAWAMPKYYTAVSDTGIKITLDKAPLTSNSGIKMFKNDTAVTGTISGSTVTFAAGVIAGDIIEVRTYKYNTSASTQTIEIDNSVFAKGVQCILETIEIDGEENPLFTVQYQFSKAIPTGNFSVNTSSERNAQSQAFNLRVIKPTTSTVVGKVMRVPIA